VQQNTSKTEGKMLRNMTIHYAWDLEGGASLQKMYLGELKKRAAGFDLQIGSAID
jgi:hypothetical protein